MNEVIIDGCNVAECKFFQCEDEEYTCSAEEGSIGAVVACRSCDNCYFKQLQRAKEENERLKSLINTHLTTFDKCCVNGLIMSNNMSEVLNEQNDR